MLDITKPIRPRGDTLGLVGTAVPSEPTYVVWYRNALSTGTYTLEELEATFENVPSGPPFEQLLDEFQARVLSQGALECAGSTVSEKTLDTMSGLVADSRAELIAAYRRGG